MNAQQQPHGKRENEQARNWGGSQVPCPVDLREKERFASGYEEGRDSLYSREQQPEDGII